MLTKEIGEPHFAAMVLRYYGGKASDIQGDSSLNTSGHVNLTFRQPYGVCCAIVAWNVPVASLTNKLAPALIAGNTLVVKSSEKAPLSVLVYAHSIKEAGFPSGVVNFRSGFGASCGHCIASHMQIRKISFTRSERTVSSNRKGSRNVELQECQS